MADKVIWCTLADLETVLYHMGQEPFPPLGEFGHESALFFSLAFDHLVTSTLWVPLSLVPV